MNIPPPPIGNLTKKKKKIEKSYRKTILFLASAFYPFSEWIEAKDVRKILLADQQLLDNMDLGTKSSYQIVQGFESFGQNQSLELIAWRLHKEYGIDFIVSASEEDLIRTAALRQLFGITHGQNYESTLRFRDKVVMKTLVKEAGLGVPEFAAIEGPIDLIRFIERVGYPIVVKPRKGYGSVNTKVLKSEESLEEFLQAGLLAGLDAPIDMMAESFVYGRFFHIDGLVANGETKLVWPSEYVNTVVDFETNNFIAGYTCGEDNPYLERLQQFMIDANTALGGPDLFPFHGEAWITPDDEIIFCEVASRTGGGGIPYEIQEAFGVSLSKTFVQYQADEPISLATIDVPWTERKLDGGNLVGWIFIYPNMGTVRSLPSHEFQPEYILFYLPYVDLGHTYESRKSCGDAVCCIIIKGRNEEEMKENILAAEKWFNTNTVYE